MKTNGPKLLIIAVVLVALGLALAGAPVALADGGATSGCRSQMIGPWQPMAQPYADFALEPGKNEIWLVDLWFVGSSLPITESVGAVWPISSESLRGKTDKVKLVMVVPYSATHAIHFANTFGGVGWIYCANDIMTTNSWTYQQAFEAVSDAADTHAMLVSQLNSTGTNQEFVFRANFPYAIPNVKALLNCVTPGSNGVPACNAMLAPPLLP